MPETNSKEIIEEKKIVKKFLKITLIVIIVGFAGLLTLGAIESSQQEEAAKESGFDSVAEYKKAKRENISTKAEYDEFVKRQAQIDAEAAINGGFLSVDEYKEAKAVSMPTKELYDKHLVQQAELKLAERKHKAEEAEKARLAQEGQKKEQAELKSVATESFKTKNVLNTEKISSEVLIPDHMKVENVKKVIKDYLGPCTGKACQINIDLLNEYLKKHEDYSKGKISALVMGPSGSKHIEAYLRNGTQIEVSYYSGTLNSMSKKRDTVKIDKNEIISIYSVVLKNYGAEVFEDWYRGSTNGIRALKANINNFVNSKAAEYMNNKASKAADEWDNI